MATPLNPGPGKASAKLGCPEVEPLFAEYLDGTLAPEAKAQVEDHLATCPGCTEALAEVRRGLAWLRLLRNDAIQPVPPVGLLEKILARTADGASPAVVAGVPGASDPAPARTSPWSSVNLAAVRRTGLLEPRLALTAAMAFFSISVTLSVAGIRPVDLKPSNLRRTVTRTYSDANARVSRYYENMRVVYELESRVRELRRAAETTNRPTQNKDQKAKPAPKSTPQSDTTQHPSRMDDGVARKDGKSSQQQKNADPKESEPEPHDYGDVVEARLELPSQRPNVAAPAVPARTFSPSSSLDRLTAVSQRSMA